MLIRARSLVAAATLVAMLAGGLPISAAGGRLEGLVVDLDGRPATDHRVHLIGSDGRPVASSRVSGEGRYTFPDLAAGEYALGVESPGGLVAPVAAPPVEVGADRLVRRDLRLVRADADAQAEAAGSSYGMGLWWAGLSPAAKAWVIVAIVVAAGITWTALDDDEEPSSPDGAR
jgi:hypothetical protein